MGTYQFAAIDGGTVNIALRASSLISNNEVDNNNERCFYLFVYRTLKIWLFTIGRFTFRKALQ